MGIYTQQFFLKNSYMRKHTRIQAVLGYKNPALSPGCPWNHHLSAWEMIEGMNQAREQVTFIFILAITQKSEKRIMGTYKKIKKSMQNGIIGKPESLISTTWKPMIQYVNY